MKTTSYLKRGGAFALVKIMVLLAVIALLACFVLPQKAAAQAYITPNGSYINGTTNTVTIGNSNYINSVVGATATNYFNLSLVQQSQADTNRWPALPLFLAKNRASWRNMALFNQFNLMASNGVTLNLRLACSPDGNLWVSNALSVSWNTNGAFATGLNVNSFWPTNNGGAPFWCVQQIENSGPAPMTNWIFIPVAVPGL